MALRLPFISAKKSEKDLVIIKFIILNFGYRPTDVNIFKKALRHKSLSSGDLNSNERLEFLGDAVLGTVIAEYIFNIYPYKDEGFLTQLRSKIVNGQNLKELSIKFGFNKLLKTNLTKEAMRKKLWQLQAVTMTSLITKKKCSTSPSSVLCGLLT